MATMKKRTRVQRWPQDVPVAIRKKLADGPQACAFRRLLLATDEEAFDAHRVRLARYLMALVTRGNLLIERPEGGRWVKEGDAVLVLPGQIKITEFPDYPGGSVDILYVLFSTRFIRDAFLNDETVDFFANQVYPAFSDIYVLVNFVPRVMPMIQAKPPERAFATMMNYIVNGMFAVGFMFLKDAFFKPKRALDLFLERYVGDPQAEDSAASAYPGGLRALCRDCKVYTGMMPAAWLRKRRMQIARVWIRHGDMPIEHIAAVLGYRTRSNFRDDYWEAHRRDHDSEERRYDLRSMPAAAYVNLVSPFWRVTEEKLSAPPEMTEMNGRRRISHSEEFKPRRRKKTTSPANDADPATAGADAADAKSDLAGDKTKADEIPAPDHPGLIVPDASDVDTEVATSRESFACLKTTGAEVIYFPNIVTASTTAEMAEHLRTTRMWDLVEA